VWELAEENWGGVSEARRRRRRDRDTEGVEGREMGRGRRKLPSGSEAEPRAKTGFGAFCALKTHVLTIKFSIFDIFAICAVSSDPTRQINKRN